MATLTSMSRREVLQLYKSLIKESKQFPAYNFRNYALRRIRDGFRETKDVTDPEQVSRHIAEGYRNLEIIKRQVLIGKMYSTDKLVIENVQVKKA